MSRDHFVDGEGSDFDGISLSVESATTPEKSSEEAGGNLTASQSPTPASTQAGALSRHVPAASKIMNVRRVPGVVQSVPDADAIKAIQRIAGSPASSPPSPSPPVGEPATAALSSPSSRTPPSASSSSSSSSSSPSASSSASSSSPSASSPSASSPAAPSAAAQQEPSIERSRTPPVGSSGAQKNAHCALILDLLNEQIVDIERLRKASWNGIPLQVRGTVWKILLGYLPCNQERRESTLERKRQAYLKYVARYFSDAAITEREDDERDLLHQINIDVLRTHPNCQLFRDPHIQAMLERALFIWSVQHPASGYVQGINELITPFLVVFLFDELSKTRSFADGDAAAAARRWTSETVDVQQWLSTTTSIDPDAVKLDLIEADCFWCMTKLLSNVQTHYTFAQPGIQKMLFKLEAVMQRIDAPLCSHLAKHSVMFLDFAFRWMNCYLMREIPLHHIVRMWDTYMCEDEGFSTFHVYVCAAFLNLWSKKLLQCDFQSTMLFLQSAPTDAWTREDLEILLSQAYILRSQHEPQLAHLK